MHSAELETAVTSASSTVGHEKTPSPDVDDRRATLAALTAWALLVGSGAVLVYLVLVAPGSTRLDAAPLHAAVDPEIAVWIVLPISIGAVTAFAAPRLTCTLRWRSLLPASWALAAGWSVSLAAMRGWGRLTVQLQRPGEYLAVLPRIDSIGDFLGGFVTNLPLFPVHVQGHPPGFVMVAWTLREAGLGGALPASMVCILVGAAAVPAVLSLVRDVAGEAWARRAVPFVVVSPAAIWVATSADAFYAGVGAVAVLLVVRAVLREGVRGDVLALCGGALFAVTAFLSYGLVLLAAVPLVAAIRRRRVRPIALAAIGGLPVLLAFLAAGFWWVDGLVATHDRYYSGIASRRPYELFLLANLSCFAIALGPAIAVGLSRLRDTRMWAIVGAALVAVALADLSGMSKSEVERIWLPFAPFVLVSGAALARPARRDGVLRLSRARPWVMAQAGAAILLETLVRTAW